MESIRLTLLQSAISFAGAILRSNSRACSDVVQPLVSLSQMPNIPEAERVALREISEYLRSIASGETGR